MAKPFFVRSLFLLAAALAVPQVGQAVSRFDTAEIVLRSTSSFNGTSGTPNPFTSVDLQARVTSPSGRVYNVFGFFDGDGAGGAVGNVFKVRVYADELGTWRWTTTSNTAGLNGQSGSFDVSGTLPGAFGKGPVVPNPARPRTFMFQYGEPVYLLGKFLDAAAPSGSLRYSHTLLSERLDDATRHAMLNRHLGMGLNKMNVYLANIGDYGGVATTPWVGLPASSDKERFDLQRWRMYDQWVRTLRDSGMVAHLWFFADDSGFGDLPHADRQRLVRYGMARLSGYANTMFVLMLEWQEGWDSAEIDSHMNFLHSNNPWARMATIHGVPGDFTHPQAAWADYLDTQAGNYTGHDQVHDHGLRNRALAVKPVIQEEFGEGPEDTDHRQKAWAAFVAGAAGSGTGAFLAPLASFISQVDFERMDPAGALALSGNAYVLAEQGQAYVAYLYNGGTLRFNLRGTSGTFAARWFDPRVGGFRDAGTVAAGQDITLTAPGSGDWTLLLTRATSPSPTPPPPPPPAPAPAPPPPSPSPTTPVTRAQIADALVAAMRGSAFVPPAPTGVFSDVSASHWAAREIEQLHRDRLTGGCGTSPLRYCPDTRLSRAEMAVLLLLAKHGTTYRPPAATGIFGDVPRTHWAAAWIEQFYRERFTAGCSTTGRFYCPESSVTEMELSVFLSTIFGS